MADSAAMYFRTVLFLIGLLSILGQVSALALNDSASEGDVAIPSALRVTNHHSFPVRESIAFPLPADLAEAEGNLLAVSHSVSGGTVEAHYLPLQVEANLGDQPATAWIDVQLRAGESRLYTFQSMGGASASGESVAAVTERFPNNLPRKIELSSGTTINLLDLAFLHLPHPVATGGEESREALREALRVPASLTFELVEESHGFVKSTLHYRSAADSTQPAIDVRYALSSSGITDIEVTFQTDNSTSRDESWGLANRIPRTEAGMLRHDGRVLPLGAVFENASSAAPGNVGWLAWEDPDSGDNRALLRDRMDLVNQLVDHEGQWFLVGATGGETQPLRYRLLPSANRSPEAVDQVFIAFAGYQARVVEGDEFHVSFGLRGVQFGVNLPKSPETNLLRDFRIANALGIEWARFDDFHSPDAARDFLKREDGKRLIESLEAVADAARQTGLGLLLSFSLSPADARLVAERFGDVITFYEIANEDRSQHRLIRAQIREVHPEAIVFPRPPFREDGFDALAESLTVEIGESATRTADLALSLAGRARASAQTPVLSNFRPQTDRRESETAQANQLFDAYEHLLAPRSIPYVFNSGFAATANGEPQTLLRPDGTPNVMALAFHEIIRRYGTPNNRLKTLEINLPVASIRPGQTTTVPVVFRNTGSRPLEIESRMRLPDGWSSTTEDTSSFTLRPRESRTLERSLTVPDDIAPGFYHLFEEAHYGDTIRLGWSYAAHRGTPAIDLERAPAEGVHYAGGPSLLQQINLANLRHLVFGQDAANEEIAAGVQLGNRLRQVTGVDIRNWPDTEFSPADQTRSHVLVGTLESNSHLQELAARFPVNPADLSPGEGLVLVIDHPTELRRFVLVITGRDSAGVERAVSDLMGRF